MSVAKRTGGIPPTPRGRGITVGFGRGTIAPPPTRSITHHEFKQTRELTLGMGEPFVVDISVTRPTQDSRLYCNVEFVTVVRVRTVVIYIPGLAEIAANQSIWVSAGSAPPPRTRFEVSRYDGPAPHSFIDERLRSIFDKRRQCFTLPTLFSGTSVRIEAVHTGTRPTELWCGHEDDCGENQDVFEACMAREGRPLTFSAEFSIRGRSL